MPDGVIIPGSCLCGQIRYEAIGDPWARIICHCVNCRKVTGASFMANSFYSKPQVRILVGEELLKRFNDNAVESGNVLHRSFCTECGSTLFTTRSVDGVEGDGMIVASGTLDLPTGQEWVPMRELFCKDRAAWLPEFEGTEKMHKMPAE